MHSQQDEQEEPQALCSLGASSSAPGSTSGSSLPKTPPSSSNGPPRSGSGGDPTRKEMSRLLSELRMKEKLLANAERNLLVCEQELEALERECKRKLADAQQEVSASSLQADWPCISMARCVQSIRLREEKDTDERNFVQALELKDAQVQAQSLELDTLRTKHSEQASVIDQLQEELRSAVEMKDSLWANSASASDESSQLISSLRSELQETLQSMNNLKREFADSKRGMFARQSQLEKTNTELVQNVADLERELVRAKELAASATAVPVASGGGIHASPPLSNGGLQDDYRRVQQTLMVTKKALHDETRKNEVQRQEILTLTQDVRHWQSAMQATQETTAKQIATLKQENEALKQTLTHAESSRNASSAAESEARIHTLTNRLIEKQEALEVVRSRVSTLEVRLLDATTRSQNAEDKLAQIERNGGFADMEMATPVGKRPDLGGGGALRSRSNRMASAIYRVAPVVERSARVVTALDVLDRWLLFLGRVFLSMPFARLVMLCYVALLHFWVFMVLSFHTSHLQEEMHPDAAANAPPDAADALFPQGPP